MSQRIFSVILRGQLKVDRATFWHVVQTCEPADRPSPEEEPAPPQHALYVVKGLRGCGWSEDQIRRLSPEEAESALHTEWSKPA